MQGIDISSHQNGIDLRKVPCDFVIIKATEGTTYKNPDFPRTLKQALLLGKKVGIYHYASKGGSSNEARHFVDTVMSMDGVGKAILILDWEKGGNYNFGNVEYAKAFLDYVKARTKVTPFIYMSKSVTREKGWDKVASIYPLWRAQYANYVETGYKEKPWTDKYGDGPWGAPAIFQYTSVGKLPGWAGHLDLDISYLTDKEWDAWCKQDKGGLYSKPQESALNYDTSTYPIIKMGHKNAWVRLLQNGLTVRGYSVASDGVFGSSTRDAVKNFQKDYGLYVDGVVGPKTWKAIFY